MTEQAGTILVGEDEAEVRDYLGLALKCLGYSVEFAQDGDEVLERLGAPESRVSAVLLDLIMPQRDGIETLKEIRRTDPSLPVIVVSGASSTLEVVTAVKNGATDFLTKPVSHEDLKSAISRALVNRTAAHEAPRPRAIAAPKTPPFLSGNSHMRELQSLAADIGWSEAPVLIQGETGSGKEVFARHLHACSPRAAKVFLKLNCAALPSELVESELFGYERGAFTGALQRKPGMFEMANGGTLLLDEIGDMDFRLQAKLLQVLQDQEFQRIGGKVVRVDVRIMAATHRDLENAIAERTFREDLYYRLNVVNIHLPPLRERVEDIVTLAEYLIERHAIPGRPVPTITPELQEALTNYHWPGNVRELENAIRKLVVLRDARLLAKELRQKTVPKLFVAARDEAAQHRMSACDNEAVDAPVLEQVIRAKQRAESEAILSALDSTRWNRKNAAALLQIDYKALLYKMKKLGLDEKPPKAAAGGMTFSF